MLVGDLFHRLPGLESRAQPLFLFRRPAEARPRARPGDAILPGKETTHRIYRDGQSPDDVRLLEHMVPRRHFAALGVAPFGQ